MKSKTLYFNRTLFLNLLKRYWPIFAGYFLLWLIILPLSLANMLHYSDINTAINNNVRDLMTNTAGQVLNLGLYGGVIISAIFCIFIAMAAFSYLYNARSVSMMCSLPIKREGVFLSVFTSGLVGMFAINAVIFVITVAVEAAYGVLGLNYLLQWFAMVCLSNIFFFGFASLCASFTGHILVLPLVYIVLNFTVYVVEFLSRSVMTLFIYGLSIRGDFKLDWLSPFIKLTSHTDIESKTEVLYDGTYLTIDYFYNAWGTLIAYAVAGLVFALFAMLIIKNRRMETAGDVVAVKPLKPIFKYCLSVGCALVLGIGIFSAVFSNVSTLYGIKSVLFMLLFMLFGAFVGLFAAEMLMQKTLHVFSKRNWMGLGVTAFLITSLMLCGEYDVFGYESKLPDINEVQGVNIDCAGESVLLEQPENIMAAISLHKDIISHKDANEKYTGNYNERSYYVYFLYTLKNGKTISREYSIYTPASDDIYTLTNLMNVKEAVDKRKSLEVPVNINTITDAYVSYFDKNDAMYKDIKLTAEQVYRLYTECIVPDIDDGTLGKVWFETDDEYFNNVYDCTIHFSVVTRIKENDYKGDYFNTTVTINSQRTLKWMKEILDIELCTKGESDKIMYSEYPEKYATEYAVASDYKQ